MSFCAEADDDGQARSYSDPMNARLRKLVGSFGLVAFIAAYVWAVLAVSEHLPDNTPVKLIYFAITGMAWGLPILPLISWMTRGR